MTDLSCVFGCKQWTEAKLTERKLNFNELTSLVELTPYYRYGYVAANGALLEAFEGMERIHILDFSTTHCIQWPTFIDALADRGDSPPHVRLTVSSATPPRPPRLQPTYEELGHRLTAFARRKGVPFEFHILPQALESLQASDFGLREGEALGVNCALRLHYLADETAAGPTNHSETHHHHHHHEQSRRSSTSGSYRGDFAANSSSACPRDKFLQLMLSLNPAILTLYEEDCSTTSPDLVRRLKHSYGYEWIPFDILATYPCHLSAMRLEQEQEVGKKIENIVTCEGVHRIERLESKSQWSKRMRRLKFRALPFTEDVVAELRDVVGSHAGGWGMKTDNESGDGGIQILSWKGHNVTFASSWTPRPRRSQSPVNSYAV